MYRRTAELVSAAYHESGHAISIADAFRSAVWLPKPAPRLPVRYVEIDADGGGSCVGADVYSMKWDISCIAPRYRDLMERQVVIHLSGGICEAMSRGAPPSEILAFAETHCEMDADLEKAEPVLKDLWRITLYRFEARDSVGRTLEMLEANWRAVDALAEALIERGRVEGEDVVEIISTLIRYPRRDPSRGIGPETL